jgi:FtsZ-binding cell division protein ZapB
MDRSTQILVEALQEALAHGDERRLYKSGKLEGLFPGRTGPAGAAAAQALGEGLLEIVRTEVRGKTTIEWVRLTPRGVDFLHDHQSPAAALQELREALRLNQRAAPVWLEEMRANLHALADQLATDAQKWQQRLDAMARRVEDTLRRMDEAGPLLPRELADAYPWSIDALNYIDRRKNGGAPDDCPLPELFASLTRAHPRLSVIDYHEGLRRMHERRAVRLLPANGSADLSQPEYALFDGGTVLYYAAR